MNTDNQKLSKGSKNHNQYKPSEEDGTISSTYALNLALEHWRAILADPEAGDTAKMNAANGLARFGASEMAGHGGRLHLMTRQELQAEIAKVRSQLGLV